MTQAERHKAALMISCHWKTLFYCNKEPCSPEALVGVITATCDGRELPDTGVGLYNYIAGGCDDPLEVILGSLKGRQKALFIRILNDMIMEMT